MMEDEWNPPTPVDIMLQVLAFDLIVGYQGEQAARTLLDAAEGRGYITPLQRMQILQETITFSQTVSTLRNSLTLN